MKKIKGPLVSFPTGNILYHITLASGMVITNPSAFGMAEAPTLFVPAIVAEDGRILALRQGNDAISRFERLTTAMVSVPKEAEDKAENA